MFYKTRISYHPNPNSGPVDTWFASLDGENFIEVNQEPSPGDQDTLRDVLVRNPNRPLTVTTYYLKHASLDPIEIIPV